MSCPPGRSAKETIICLEIRVRRFQYESGSCPRSHVSGPWSCVFLPLLVSPRNYTAPLLAPNRGAGSAIDFKKVLCVQKNFLVLKTQNGVYNPYEDTHGRRYITYV
jgi:hypothetical protein